jgi:thiamine biosynthesis lipoprotein
MGRLVIVWLIGAGAVAAQGEQPAENRFEFSRTEMAVPVRVVLYAPDEKTANGAAEAAFDRLHQLNGILSDYDPNSELRRLCDASSEGRSVPVSEDLWNVLSYAQALSTRTCGAFDVTVGPIVRLWRRARRREELPPPEMIKESLDLVGHRLVRLEPETHGVELLKPGMRLDLGGIAKGYAIDQALAVLRRRGITRALVDAGGDVGLGDPPPDRPGWQIAVAALDPNSPPSRYVQLSCAAIATSGDTWQFVEFDGKRYSHLVDPHTGVGLTDHSTVTIVAPNAMTADALASAVSVLGPEKGIRLIDDTPGSAAFIVRAPEGRVETYESEQWKHLHLLQPSSD